MANQMIALGVRGPQLPDVGAINARYANIMANTAVAREKQVAAQRANAFRQLVSSPDFDPYNPENIKAAAALDPEGAAKIAQSFDTRRKAEQTYAVEQIKRLRDFGAAVRTKKDTKHGWVKSKRLRLPSLLRSVSFHQTSTLIK